MKSSDLTESEKKVWQAAATGTLVDLRVGDSQLDSPERWAEWGMDRTVRADHFPISVDAHELVTLTADEGVKRRAIQIREELGNPASILLGVDRLDYTKGISLRMDAFERFLAGHPDWHGKVTYLQITPKSRSEIQEYADIGRLVDETAGRINGRYGEAVWTPIRYVNRTHSRSALAGLYRSAGVGLVTPLRDGMNLVMKA